MAKKKKVATADATGLTSNPFAQLAGLDVATSSSGSQPASESAETEAIDEPVGEGGGASQQTVRRAVVRYQRKGRGGKEVTAVELRGLGSADLRHWLTDLKKRLGCGGFLEDELIVLAGDQRQRLRELLEGAGVAKISVS